jgi:hypothetical protein
VQGRRGLAFTYSFNVAPPCCCKRVPKGLFGYRVHVPHEEAYAAAISDYDRKMRIHVNREAISAGQKDNELPSGGERITVRPARKSGSKSISIDMRKDQGSGTPIVRIREPRDFGK